MTNKERILKIAKVCWELEEMGLKAASLDVQQELDCIANEDLTSQEIECINRKLKENNINIEIGTI